jgi:hypothetical protein
VGAIPGGVRVLKLEGFNLKVKLKLKLKCLRNVPEGGILEGGAPKKVPEMVSQRVPSVVALVGYRGCLAL